MRQTSWPGIASEHLAQRLDEGQGSSCTPKSLAVRAVSPLACYIIRILSRPPDGCSSDHPVGLGAHQPVRPVRSRHGKSTSHLRASLLARGIGSQMACRYAGLSLLTTGAVMDRFKRSPTQIIKAAVVAIDRRVGPFRGTVMIQRPSAELCAHADGVRRDRSARSRLRQTAYRGNPAACAASTKALMPAAMIPAAVPDATGREKW
jgi:hypothetical protein